MVQKFSTLRLLAAGVVSIYLLGIATSANAQTPPAETEIVVENFEQYQPGQLPTRWQFLNENRQLVPVAPQHMHPNEYFKVQQEQDKKFLQVYTKGEAVQIILPNTNEWNWSLKTHPCLAWDWRAHKLPKGASEDKINDTGAALYVTYSINRLGLPLSIKYTYSSTLPIGSVVPFRRLKVLVASTGRDSHGGWVHVERNIAEDYRRLWGKEPPSTPQAISLWSDSNSTKEEAIADFDNIKLLSDCQGSPADSSANPEEGW